MTKTRDKPILTPRKLAARMRGGRFHVTRDTGWFTCTVCGFKDRKFRAYDPRNYSSGDRIYCSMCQGWTVPRIEFDEVILDLVTDNKFKTPVVHEGHKA